MHIYYSLHMICTVIKKFVNCSFIFTWRSRDSLFIHYVIIHADTIVHADEL